MANKECAPKEKENVHLYGIGFLSSLEFLGLGDPVNVALQVLLHLLLRSQPLEIPARLGLLLLFWELSEQGYDIAIVVVKSPHSPAENTEDQVHDKEGTEDDHGHEVDELPGISLGIVDLQTFSINDGKEGTTGPRSLWYMFWNSARNIEWTCTLQHGYVLNAPCEDGTVPTQ